MIFEHFAFLLLQVLQQPGTPPQVTPQAGSNTIWYAFAAVALPFFAWATTSVFKLMSGFLDPKIPHFDSNTDPRDILSYQLRELGKEKLRIEHRISITSAVCVLFALASIATSTIIPGAAIGAGILSGFAGVIAIFLQRHSSRLSKEMQTLLNQISKIKEEQQKGEIRVALAEAINRTLSALGPGELLEATRLVLGDNHQQPIPAVASIDARDRSRSS